MTLPALGANCMRNIAPLFDVPYRVTVTLPSAVTAGRSFSAAATTTELSEGEIGPLTDAPRESVNVPDTGTAVQDCTLRTGYTMPLSDVAPNTLKSPNFSRNVILHFNG